MNAAIIPIVPAIQLKKILYATDLSEASRSALPIVSAIARRYGSEIYVVNVWSTLPYSMVTPEALAILENKQEQDAKSDMARLLQTSELQGLRTTPLVKSGEPTDEIQHIVGDLQIDLAIVATHGRTGFLHLLMGSLAEELLHSLSCPVLTVGPHLASRFTNPLEIKAILCPTDLSPESRLVLPYLASLAAEYKAEIIALHVARPDGKSGPDERGKEMLREQMRKLFCPQVDPRCRLEVIVDSGHPTDKILDYAKARQVDLIGLGVRPAGPLMLSHFRQTVAYKVVLEAECPVLTYRGPASW